MKGRKVYVFMIKRAVDKEEFPAAYLSAELANTAFGRSSQVVEVDFDAEVATPEERAKLADAIAEARITQATAGKSDPLYLTCGALLDLIEQLLDGRVKL